MCYEMLTGTLPFSGPPRTVISKQILDPPPPIATLRPEVPAPIAAAVHCALEKIPEARWQNGRSFRRALAGDTSTPTPVPAPKRRRRWLLPALVATVLVAAGSLSLLVRRSGPPPGVNPRHSILVLPFANLRETADYQWLEDGSVNMLTLALSQWRDLSVVDQDRVHDLTAAAGNGPIGLSLARRLARESGTWTVILGDFELVGDSVHLIARPYDVASGRRLDLVRADGLATADIRPLFDELAAKLLDLSGAPKDSRASLASVTTESLEAYRAYLQGVDHLNHWRLSEASTALNRAVGLDSGFSLANYKLAVTRGWVSPDDTAGMAAIRRAARTSERLPRRERSLIEGYRTFVEGDYRQGMSIYGDLVRRDSADVEAWYGLADAAFHGGYATMSVGLLNQSLVGFRQVIGRDSTFALAYEHVGAMLTDASLPRSWIRLTGADSLAANRDSVPGADRQRAGGEAIALAQAWTRLQPGTPRAHYHLYKAYLANGRIGEARQTVLQLGAMYPDSVRAFFSGLDARAQFQAQDIADAARIIRTAMPQINPAVMGLLDFAPEPLSDLMTGVSALGYFGDLRGATELIHLGRELRASGSEARDSVEREREDAYWETVRLGLLYASAGARTDRLRSLWTEGFALAQRAPGEKRASALSGMSAVAVSLLLGPPGDPGPVLELERVTGVTRPAPLAALVAARSGDSAAARRLLTEHANGSAPARPKESFQWEATSSDWRPVIAETWFELGDYARVVETLRQFDRTTFGVRGIDPRWVLLPRVRLLRAQALERLGRTAEASAEYQAVVDQWRDADPELLPVVQAARQGLARAAGTPEVH
ncbi:MAG: hypothetical protein R2882_00315 [Gemmatimonadales bacterium]